MGSRAIRDLRAKPRTYRAVVEAGGVELALPHRDDWNAQRVSIEQRRVFRDVDPVHIERNVQRDAMQRAIRLRAESAVGLFEQTHLPRRLAMGPAAYERERAPQVSAHHQFGGSPATFGGSTLPRG